MVKLSQDALLKLLNERKLNPVFQQENDQIYVLMIINKHEVPIFFGIRSEKTLLQTIAYIPFELTSKSKGEVARLLHLLNYQMDMPGFGMDEEQRLMFYRLVIPCPESELDERFLNLFLATTRVAVETFMGAIAMVAAGSVDLDTMKKGPQGNNGKKSNLL